MDDLLCEVQAEKEHISNTLSALKRIRTRKRKTVVELAAIAVFLHNIYNGMENLLKRILRFKKGTYLKLRHFSQRFAGFSSGP